MNIPRPLLLRVACALLALPLLVAAARLGLTWPTDRSTPALPAWAPPREGAPHELPSARPRPSALAVVVYVAGAVRHPGLVTVASTARVAAALARAVPLPEADLVAVNLAAHAEDGEEIVVPVRGTAPLAPTGSRRPATARAHGRHSPAPPKEPISLNSADARELARVPGIGTRLAGRIVAYRQTYGAFGSVDDLLDVAGVSERTLERAAPYLRP